MRLKNVSDYFKNLVKRCFSYFLPPANINPPKQTAPSAHFDNNTQVGSHCTHYLSDELPKDSKAPSFDDFKIWIQTHQSKSLKEHSAVLASVSHLVDEHQDTLLHIAVKADNLYALNLLCANKINLEARNHSGQTAFELLIQDLNANVQEDMAVALIEAGCIIDCLTAKPELLDTLYQSNLSLLAQQCQQKGIIDIHQHVQGLYSKIHLAAISGDMQFLTFASTIGANLSKADGNGLTPLHHAVKAKKNLAVKFLLSCGVDKSAVDFQTNRTALHFACIYANYPGMSLLLEYGIPVELLDSQGMSAMRILLYGKGQKHKLNHRMFPYAKLMLKNIDDISTLTDIDHAKLVSDALYHNQVELIILMGQKGLCLQSVTLSDKQNLLHQIVSRRPTVIPSSSQNPIASLIDLGISIHQKDNFGNTPLHYVRNVEDAQILLEHGASLTALNDDNFPPLFTATSNGLIEVVKFLIEKGANPHTVLDKKQENIIDIAKKNLLHTPISRMLKRLVDFNKATAFKLSTTFKQLIDLAKNMAQSKKIIFIIGESHGNYRIQRAEKILLKQAQAYGVRTVCVEQPASHYQLAIQGHPLIRWIAKKTQFKIECIDNYRSSEDSNKFNVESSGIGFRDFGMSEAITTLNQSSVVIVGQGHLKGLTYKPATKLDNKQFFLVPLNFLPLMKEHRYSSSNWKDRIDYIQVDEQGIDLNDAKKVLIRANY